MSHTNPTDVHILVVDDEPDVTEIFSHWLNTRYTATAVTSGPDALAYLEENPAVDVVLLDRRMPGMGGDEVLRKIREQGFDCMVAMITAVDPDVDIIDMDFDDYITKPADKDDLFVLIDSLISREVYNKNMEEYYSLLSKQAALQEEFTQQRLEDMEEYQSLTDRLAVLKEELDAELDLSDHDTFVSALKDTTDK